MSSVRTIATVCLLVGVLAVLTVEASSLVRIDQGNNTELAVGSELLGNGMLDLVNVAGNPPLPAWSSYTFRIEACCISCQAEGCSPVQDCGIEVVIDYTVTDSNGTPGPAKHWDNFSALDSGWCKKCLNAVMNETITPSLGGEYGSFALPPTGVEYTVQTACHCCGTWPGYPYETEPGDWESLTSDLEPLQ